MAFFRYIWYLVQEYLAPKPVLSKVEGFIWGFYL